VHEQTRACSAGQWHPTLARGGNNTATLLGLPAVPAQKTLLHKPAASRSKNYYIFTCEARVALSTLVKKSVRGRHSTSASKKVLIAKVACAVNENGAVLE